jgi:hypothetical protein
MLVEIYVVKTIRGKIRILIYGNAVFAFDSDETISLFLEQNCVKKKVVKGPFSHSTFLAIAKRHTILKKVQNWDVLERDIQYGDEAQFEPKNNCAFFIAAIIKPNA